MFKVFLMIFCVFSVVGVANADNWQLEKESNGIKVFTKNTAASSLKVFKGVVTISARLSSIVATIDDTSVYPQLFHSTKSAKELKRVSPIESYKYMVTALPWPAESRDAIVHSILKQDKKTKTIQITVNGVPKHIPERNGLVRIQKMSGRWLLVPEKNGVKVVYEMNVDPGGNLPIWLVNSMSVDLPFVTLKNLLNLVKKGKYQKVNSPFIID